MKPQRSTIFLRGLCVLSASFLLTSSIEAYVRDPVTTCQSTRDLWCQERDLQNSSPPSLTQLAQISSVTESGGSVSSCTKGDFESAVDQAASILRDLNLKNKPHFQDRLKHLKEKKRWSEDVYEKEAIRFVKDEEIDKFDGRTADVLDQITAMGDEGATAKTPDCNLLKTLQTYMNELIDTQTAKWAYIFKKLDTAMVGN